MSELRIELEKHNKINIDDLSNWKKKKLMNYVDNYSYILNVLHEELVSFINCSDGRNSLLIDEFILKVTNMKELIYTAHSRLSEAVEELNRRGLEYDEDVEDALGSIYL